MKFNPMLTTVLRYFVAGLFNENGQQKQTVQLRAENYYGSTPPPPHKYVQARRMVGKLGSRANNKQIIAWQISFLLAYEMR